MFPTTPIVTKKPTARKLYHEDAEKLCVEKRQEQMSFPFQSSVRRKQSHTLKSNRAALKENIENISNIINIKQVPNPRTPLNKVIEENSFGDPFMDKGKKSSEFVIKSPLNLSRASNPYERTHSFIEDFSPANICNELNKTINQTFEKHDQVEFSCGKNILENILEDSAINTYDTSIDSQQSYLDRHGILLAEAMEKMNMSPESYFAQKSCKFGFLDGVGEASERPFFKHPNVNFQGDVIDHLSTPFYTKESNQLNMRTNDLLSPSRIQGDNYTNQLPETPAHLRSTENNQPNRNVVDYLNREHLKPVRYAQRVLKPAQKVPRPQQQNAEPILESFPRDESIRKLIPVLIPSRQTNSADPTSFDIDFGRIPYIDKSAMSICLLNPHSSKATFSLQPMTKPKVEIMQKKHLVDGDIFSLNSLRGILNAGDQTIIQIVFKPIVAGSYAQSFFLRSNGKVATLNIIGEAYSRVATKRFVPPQKDVVDTMDATMSIVASHHIPQQFTSSSSRAPLNHSQYLSKQQENAKATSSKQTHLKHFDPPVTTRFKYNSRPPTKTLTFDTLQIGKSQSMEFRVENPKKNSCIFEIYVTAPFHVPTRKVSVQGCSYMILPIAFKPVRVGEYSTFVVVKFGNETVKVKCSGTCRK